MSSPAPDFAVRSPAAALRPYVAHYVGFRAHGLRPATHSGLPSRYFGLAISLAKPIDIVRMPGTGQNPAAFTAFVSGLRIGPATVSYGDTRDGLFVQMTPAGVHAVLGVKCVELSSRVVDFSAVWGKAADRLVERLAPVREWQRRFDTLDQAFLKTLHPATPPREVSWAWTRLAQTHGCIPIHELANEVGWTRQHFRERFHAEVGVAPKVAARIFRFERALRLLKDTRPNLAQVAATCGFHDQAHMTLEWNALAGCTPGEWISRELPFFQYNEPSGGDDGIRRSSHSPR